MIQTGEQVTILEALVTIEEDTQVEETEGLEHKPSHRKLANLYHWSLVCFQNYVSLLSCQSHNFIIKGFYDMNLFQFFNTIIMMQLQEKHNKRCVYLLCLCYFRLMES